MESGEHLEVLLCNNISRNLVKESRDAEKGNAVLGVTCALQHLHQRHTSKSLPSASLEQICLILHDNYRVQHYHKALTTALPAGTLESMRSDEIKDTCAQFLETQLLLQKQWGPN